MKNLDFLIQKPQVQTDTFAWATVTAVTPLRIRLDGDTVALDITPDSLAPVLDVGDRVWCQMHGRRMVVLGRSGTPTPTP